MITSKQKYHNSPSPFMNIFIYNVYSPHIHPHNWHPFVFIFTFGNAVTVLLFTTFDDYYYIVAITIICK